MRKFPILPLIALLAAGLTTACENSRPLTEAELPAASQRFLSEHFPGVEISFAKVDTELFDKEYKVVFVTGSKVEFDRRGAWKEIDCKYGEVPSGIVPQPIRAYVEKHFPGRRIACLERDRRDYEIELDNGFELISTTDASARPGIPAWRVGAACGCIPGGAGKPRSGHSGRQGPYFRCGFRGAVPPGEPDARAGRMCGTRSADRSAAEAPVRFRAIK